MKKQVKRVFRQNWGDLLKIDSNSEGTLLILIK
jgi:hypothetical protein